MNRNQFWDIINKAISSCDDIYDVAPIITKNLVILSPDEIISFKQHQYDLEKESYRWDLWAVAYIVNGGCSDDGFDYFCAWLIANGQEKFEAAMKNPASIGDWADDEGDFEDMMYVAIDAYSEKTGTEFPYDSVTSSRPSDPIGDSWDEEDLEKMFPALCEKFY
jgi:hypothetical protein